MFHRKGLHLFKSFKWRKKILSSWEAFCLFHSDAYRCNKYTWSLKGFTEKGGSLAFLYSFFNFSRGWVMYEMAISLRMFLRWDSGFQISNTHTHTHNWKERVWSDWDELLTYWGGAAPSVVFPDLQLLHLSWDQLLWLFQLKRNPENTRRRTYKD